MSDAYAHEVGRKLCLQLSSMTGYEGVSDNALDVLSDVMKSFIQQNAIGARTYSEHSGRTEINAKDVLLSLEDMGHSIEQLIDFEHETEEVPFGATVPKFPVQPVQEVYKSFKQQQIKSPGSIPDYLPVFPAEHTYRETALYVQKPQDSKTKLKKSHEAKKTTEDVLIKFGTKDKREDPYLSSLFEEFDANHELIDSTKSIITKNEPFDSKNHDQIESTDSMITKNEHIDSMNRDQIESTTRDQVESTKSMVTKRDQVESMKSMMTRRERKMASNWTDLILGRMQRNEECMDPVHRLLSSASLSFISSDPTGLQSNKKRKKETASAAEASSLEKKTKTNTAPFSATLKFNLNPVPVQTPLVKIEEEGSLATGGNEERSIEADDYDIFGNPASLRLEDVDSSELVDESTAPVWTPSLGESLKEEGGGIANQGTSQGSDTPADNVP
eukprot:g7707.t1